MQKVKSVNLIELPAFGTCTILLSLWVYVANDETQLLIGIFRLDYLIPTLMYVFLMLLPAILLCHLLKMVANRITSVLIGIFVGIPLGIFLTMKTSDWIFK